MKYSFPSDSAVQQRYVFTQLQLNGTFRAKREQLSVTMPTTLAYNLLPLNAKLFNFHDSELTGWALIFQLFKIYFT